MSRQINELQSLLNQFITEHRKLLRQLDLQHEAMKKLDLNAMDEAIHQQEAIRLRLTALEVRRKGLMQQINITLRCTEELTLRKLAEMLPPHAPALLKLRTELRGVIDQIRQRTYIGSKLAAGVLGHLNMGVRLLARAVERAGIYTRDGVPQMKTRIGVMNAVG